MSKGKYFEPDLQQLNRRAKRLNNNKSPVDKLIDLLLDRNKKRKPVQYSPEQVKELSTLIGSIKKEADWEQELSDASYLVFDTETTGLYPNEGDEIISIGAVIVEKGKILEEPRFHEMVNPGRPVSPQTEKITGITDEMLVDKPELIPVLLRFLRFTGARIMVAHNASFDLAFINNRLGEAIGRRIVNPVIDTVLLTSSLYYALGDYSLESLAPRFNLSLEGRHDALGDAAIAASLFICLLAELEAIGVKNLPSLIRHLEDSNPARGYPPVF